MLPEPFLLRALLAGLGLAVVAAPLGCFVVWRRMAYYGETVAQAGLIGVAIGLAFSMNLTASVLIVTLALSLLLVLLGFSWWSAEMREMEWHRISGTIVLGLVVFRLIWGFVGGEREPREPGHRDHGRAGDL